MNRNPLNWRVWTLWFHGFSVDEIGAELNLTATQVWAFYTNEKQRARKAQARLRSEHE